VEILSKDNQHLINNDNEWIDFPPALDEEMKVFEIKFVSRVVTPNQKAPLEIVPSRHS
jgi:hypothetical protein